MSVASITLKRRTPLGPRQIRRQIAIQLANNYTTGGETIDLTTMLNPAKIEHGKFGGVAGSVKALPQSDDIYTVKIPNGYDAILSQAAASPTLKNFVLQIFTSGGTELAQAGYPAGLLGVDLVFEVLTTMKYS